MKKTMIAGAASIALAAMPVVGAFAATSVTDTITANVTDSCSFNRTAGEGTYATSILPNAIAENFASSSFAVTCNFGAEGKDINVTATFTDLVSGDNTIPYAGGALAAGTAGWNAAAGEFSTGATPIADNGNLIDVTAATEDQTATVWYSVATADDQATGAYKGYATYTLAEN